MEPEGSLPHSQEPAACSYPEPERSSLFPHPTFIRSILILSTHLRLGLSSGLRLSDFTTKTLCALDSPHTCYMPRPSQPLKGSKVHQYVKRNLLPYVQRHVSVLIYY